MVGCAQHLQRHVHHDRPEDRTGQRPRAAEDDHRVDRDQQRHVEVGGEDARVERGEQRPREAGDARTHRKGDQLEPVDRHPHQLGRERILAQRAPRAPGARLAHRVQRRHHDEERDQGRVEVTRDAVDLAAEEMELVDVDHPVRAAGRVEAVMADAEERHAVPVLVDRHEQLAEEQRHDREVVADEPS